MRAWPPLLCGSQLTHYSFPYHRCVFPSLPDDESIVFENVLNTEGGGSSNSERATTDAGRLCHLSLSLSLSRTKEGGWWKRYRSHVAAASPSHSFAEAGNNREREGQGV